MMWWFWVAFSWAHEEPCKTLELLPRDGWRLRAFSPVPEQRSEKQNRDAYQLENAVFSDNFAVRWGTQLNLSPDQSTWLLAALENTWRIQIDEQQYPEPFGADSHRFNVYIGDSGGPPDYGVAGYYTLDDDGWPMVVLNAAVVDSYATDTMPVVIPHEFFHAVQHASQRFDYTTEDAWYWEASAVWMESFVYPQSHEYIKFLFGFAFFPHYPLDFYDAYGAGDLQEFYQYGAFVFLQYLIEFWVDEKLVYDSWVAPVTAVDPLAVLQELLAQQGFQFSEVVNDFAAHNAFWDYMQQELYRQQLELYAMNYPSQDARIAEQIHAAGTSDWVNPPLDTLPQRYGYNHILLANPTVSSLQIAVDGEAYGSANSQASWAATVVHERQGSYDYYPLSFTDGQGHVLIDNLQASDSMILSVVAWTDEDRIGEYFDYRYQFVDPAAQAASDKSNGRCGCAGEQAMLLPWLLVLAMRRRFTASVAK